MNPLVPCPSCARHVRASESHCPFCQGELPSDLGTAAVPNTRRRLDRVAAFTFATTVAIAGCAGGFDGESTDSQEQESVGGIQPMYGNPPIFDAGPPVTDAGTPDANPCDAGPIVIWPGGGWDDDDPGSIHAMYGLPVVIDPCADQDAGADDGGAEDAGQADAAEDGGAPDDGGAIHPMYGLPPWVL